MHHRLARMRVSRMLWLLLQCLPPTELPLGSPTPQSHFYHLTAAAAAAAATAFTPLAMSVQGRIKAQIRHPSAAAVHRRF